MKISENINFHFLKYFSPFPVIFAKISGISGNFRRRSPWALHGLSMGSPLAPGLTKEKGDLRSDEAEGRSPFSFVPQRRFAPGVAEGNRRPFGVPGEYYISSTLRVNPHRGSIVQCTIPILFRRDVLLQRFSLFSMGKGLAVRRLFGRGGPQKIAIRAS